VPVRGEVVWELESGDFSYYRWEILDVEVNRPALYPGGAEGSGAPRASAGAKVARLPGAPSAARSAGLEKMVLSPSAPGHADCQ
jgi:hypothetical protein